MKEIFDNLTHVNVNCILHIYIYPECKEKSVWAREYTYCQCKLWDFSMLLSAQVTQQGMQQSLQTQHTAKSPLDLTFLIDFFPFE